MFSPQSDLINPRKSKQNKSRDRRIRPLGCYTTVSRVVNFDELVEAQPLAKCFLIQTSIAQRRLITIYYSPSGNTHSKPGTIQTHRDRQSQSEGFVVKESHFWDPILTQSYLQTPVVLSMATGICQNKDAHRNTSQTPFFPKETRYVWNTLAIPTFQYLPTATGVTVQISLVKGFCWRNKVNLHRFIDQSPSLGYRKVVILFFCSISNFSNKEAWLRQTVRGLSA